MSFILVVPQHYNKARITPGALISTCTALAPRHKSPLQYHEVSTRWSGTRCNKVTTGVKRNKVQQGDDRVKRNKVKQGGTMCIALAQAEQSLFRVPAYNHVTYG